MFAVLIPWTYDRQKLFDRVVGQLMSQWKSNQFMIFNNVDQGHKAGGLSTGAKRNALLDQAIENGYVTHIAFVDSDDLVGPNYIKHQLAATEGDFDCAELWGQYYENGKQMNPFHHSIVHDHWWQDNKFYYRNPNHLNCIALRCLKDIRFQDKTVGEDGHYSIDLQKAGVLKTQYPVNEIIYYYFAGGRKDHSQEQQMALRRGVKL